MWVLSSVTFVSVTIPLALLLIPLSPTMLGKRLTRQPSQTLAPDEGDQDPVRESGLTYQQFCSQQLRPVNHTLPAASAAANAFRGDTSHYQYREIFCVFDTKYYRSADAVYLPLHIPYDFCSSLIYSSVAVFHEGVQWRRPSLDSVFVPNLTDTGQSAMKHRGHPRPVYLTIGGEPEDSANFTKVFRNDERRARFAHAMADFMIDNKFAGLHLDWDYPHGTCGDRTDRTNLFRFAQMIRSLRPERFLLLSVRPERVHLYGLEQLLPLLLYVVVATHKPPAGRRSFPTVQCSAPGDVVATTMDRIRRYYDPTMWTRFIYSVAVGADTFTTEGSVGLGAPSKGPSSFDYYTHQPRRTRYDLVCQLPRSRHVSDECSVGYATIQGSVDVKVATFAGPKEIRTRLNRAYDLALGETPIVVYDIDLDDFQGKCPGNAQSPQIGAYATATYEP
ncbi:putative chitinase 2 [Amblyomma americanum]